MGFLVLLTAACAQGGKIIFKESEERPRNDRRFGGGDIYPPSTVWGPVQVTSSPAPGIANNSISSDSFSNETELTASCPDAAAWCSEPSNYPEETILRAVEKQGDSIHILFPKEQKQKEVLRLDPSIPVDESLLGNRFGPTDDVEGSGEEGSGEEGSGEIDAVGNGREMVDDLHEAEEMHEDGFENICGLTIEYLDHKLVALSESGEELV